MTRILPLIAVLLLWANPALAWMPHGSPGFVPPPFPVCPYVVDGGCAGANQNGYFINTGFVIPGTLTTPGNFGYAVMSSQSTTLYTHPMNWNLAGVDYPVAYDKTLTLKSPDPLDANHATLPTGCSYNRTGGTTGNAVVSCSNTGAATVTFNGWDFGETANHSCVQLLFGAFNDTGSHVVTNSRFHAGGTSCASSTVAWFIKDQSASNTLDVENNLFDGYYYTNGGNWDGINDSQSATGGSLTIQYNAFVNMGSRFADAVPRNPETIQYNYFQDEVLTTQQHGEIIDYGAVANVTLTGNIAINYNTEVQTTYYHFVAAAIDVTTNVWLAETGFNWVVTGNVEIGHNTFVQNQSNNNGSWSTNTGYAIMGLGYGGVIQGTLNVHDNYADPTGANSCYQNNAAGTYTGSVSGTTFTVTAVSGGPPTPGMMLTNSAGLGFVNAVIQAYGTIDPNTGLPSTCTLSVRSGCTLVLSGGNQTIASNGTWVGQFGLGTFTESNNINLKDGSAITTGYSATAPGPYNMNSGAGYHCNGANSRS